jgi:hypothetical protein
MDADLLRSLAVDPAALDRAPARLRAAAARERFGRPCSVCGAPARATTIVALSEGCCWLDTCRDHMLAVARLRPSRMPSTVEGIAADLRAAAVETGVDLTILTSDGMAG